MKSINLYIETLKVRNVFLLSLMTFFYSLTFYTTVFTLFLIERGLNYFEIFLLESILSASILLFEVPSGILADRWGRKKVLIFSVVLFAISTYIVALSHSFLWFVVESVLYGVGIAVMSGADSAFIYESLANKQKKQLADYSFSVINATASIAMILSLPIGGVMAEYSLELPVVITCLSLTVAVIISFFLKETSFKNKTENSTDVKFPFRFLLKDGGFLFYIQFVQSIGSGFIFSLIYLNQPLFISYNIELKYFGWIMLVIHLFVTAIILLAPWVRRKIGISWVLLLTNLLPGISLFIISFTSSVGIGLFLFSLVFFIHALNDPIYRTFVNEQIPDHQRATILSVISFVGSIVGMCLKPIIGLLTDINIQTTLLVMGIVMVLVSLFIPLVVKHIGYVKENY